MQKVVITSASEIPDPKPTEGWITFSRRNFSPGKAEFGVRVSAKGLEPGPHTAFLAFPDGKKVLVNLMVPDRKVQVEPTAAPEAIELQPDSLSFLPGTPEQTVAATGAANIPDPTSTDPWLTFTRRDIAPGKAEFSVQVSSAGLAAGPTLHTLPSVPKSRCGGN